MIYKLWYNVVKYIEIWRQRTFRSSFSILKIWHLNILRFIYLTTDSFLTTTDLTRIKNDPFKT